MWPRSILGQCDFKHSKQHSFGLKNFKYNVTIWYQHRYDELILIFFNDFSLLIIYKNYFLKQLMPNKTSHATREIMDFSIYG